MRFLNKTFCIFFDDTVPASNIANPHCINTTKKPDVRIHCELISSDS